MAAAAGAPPHPHHPQHPHRGPPPIGKYPYQKTRWIPVPVMDLTCRDQIFKITVPVPIRTFISALQVPVPVGYLLNFFRKDNGMINWPDIRSGIRCIPIHKPTVENYRHVLHIASGSI
jgi:hypothetical protein